MVEWTGARYADGPTVEVETYVEAAPHVPTEARDGRLSPA